MLSSYTELLPPISEFLSFLLSVQLHMPPVFASTATGRYRCLEAGIYSKPILMTIICPLTSSFLCCPPWLYQQLQIWKDYDTSNWDSIILKLSDMGVMHTTAMHQSPDKRWVLAFVVKSRLRMRHGIAPFKTVEEGVQQCTSSGENLWVRENTLIVSASAMLQQSTPRTHSTPCPCSSWQP